MINFRTATRPGIGIALLAALAPLAQADQHIDIEKNRVVPVILDQKLSVRDSRRGDRFTATVADDYDLPNGTRFYGRVLDVHKRSDIQPPFIEVEFDRLRLPDGTREDIRAQPISMDGGIVKKDRWGHYYASRKVYHRDQTVVGGAVVGLVLGSLVHRPVEGAIIGGLAGVIVGMDQRTLADNETIPRGTRMGALFENPVHMAYNRDDWRDRGYANNNDDNYNRRPADEDTYDQDGRYSGSDRTQRDRDYRGDYRDTRVTYRGNELRYSDDARPFWIGNVLMVPLTRTADQLDLSVDSYQSDNTIIVEGDNSNLRLEQGSRRYRLNGRYGTLTHELVVRNGVTFAPIEVLAAMKRQPVLVNGSRVEGN